MEGIDYDSPGRISAFLKARGLAPQKQFGQNFMVNPSARAALVAALGLEPGMRVWEIGPGIGSITKLLLEAGARPTVFEIDHGYARLLEELFPGIALVEGDFLKTFRAAFEDGGLPDRVVGNLPYNSASAMVAAFAEKLPPVPRMVFTVQKEGADRMRARPGDADYSAYSVLCRSRFKVRVLLKLGPASFYPAPDVSSAAVELVPDPAFPLPADPAFFSRLTRALFATRRKTIRNNLIGSGLFPGERIEGAWEALAALGIDPQARAETLEPERIAELSSALLPHAYQPAPEGRS